MIDTKANKPGYKKTKLGWIPEDWEIISLSQHIDILLSNVDKHIVKDEQKILLCNYTDVYYNEYITKDLNFSIGSAKEREIDKFKLQKGDVIITKDSEDRSDIAVPTYVNDNVDKLICGYHLAILRSDSTIDGNFLSKLIQFDRINHFLQRRANGITRFGLTKETLENTLIYLPPLPEQQKIAQILSTWDQAIEKTEQLIEKKQRLKKGLMQQLFKGKMRFEEFKEANDVQKTKIGLMPKDWKTKKASEIFENVSVKNNDEDEELLSATQEYGVIPRNILEGKVTMPNGNLKSFKLVEKGDFVISLRTFQGGIEYSYYRGLVSPAYTVLKEKVEINKDFYRHLFKTKDFISRLASSVIGIRDGKQINYSDFKLMHIIYPPLEEQNKIAVILNGIEKELQIWKSYSEKLKQQKKGLMQQLLTGKIRVKTD